MKKISVVAIARPDDKCRTVEGSFAGFDYPPELKELVVIRGRSPSAQRNAGVAGTSGDIVLFSDDDMSFPPDHLSRCAEFFAAHPGAGALGGPVLPAPGQSVTQEAHACAIASRLLSGKTASRYSRTGPPRVTDDDELLSCNLMVPRKVLEDVGGFNESLYPGEDVELIRRIMRKYEVYYSPEMAAFRPMRKGFGAHFRMFLNYGRKRPEIELRLGERSPAFMVPSLFLLYLAAVWPLSLLAGGAAFLPLGLYASLLVLSAFRALFSGASLPAALLCPVFIFSGHAAYGAGYARGWLKNLLYYPRKMLFLEGDLPSYLIFYVTNRCNMRCGHCFYWKELEGPSSEMTLEEIEKVCSSLNGLFHVILTGGEPYLREDLGGIIEAFHVRAGARVITIPTNGSFGDRMVSTLVPVLKRYPGLVINQNVSFDGLEKDHDRVRRCPGAYRRAAAAFGKLRELREELGLRNLNLGVIVTFNEENQDDFPGIVRGLYEELLPDNIAINLIRGDPREKINTRLSFEKYSAAVRERDRLLFSRSMRGASSFRFHTAITAMRTLVNSVVEKTWREGRFQAPCHACRTIGVVYPKGDVFPCELLPRPLGNLKEAGYDLGRVWSGAAAAAERKRIARVKCFCTHECFVQAGIMFNFRFYPALAWRALRLMLSGGRPR